MKNAFQYAMVCRFAIRKRPTIGESETLRELSKNKNVRINGWQILTLLKYLLFQDDGKVIIFPIIK